MRIRFLQTVPSQAPGYPFVTGQVITLAPEAVTDEMRTWIARGWAEFVRSDAEAAVLVPAERAALPRPKGKGHR